LTTPHNNDRIRVYGLVMTRIYNREMYQKLADGITHCSQLEDPKLGFNKLFQNIVLEFTNKKIVLTLPEKYLGIDGIQDINPNYRRWMRANRD